MHVYVQSIGTEEGSMTNEAAPLSRPMNVEQIVKQAESYEYNPLIALKYWLRTAGTLLKEVRFASHLSLKQGASLTM